MSRYEQVQVQEPNESIRLRSSPFHAWNKNIRTQQRQRVCRE